MTYTDQASYDNLSMHAVTIPVGVWCRRVTLRELATDATGTAYSIAAPLSTSSAFPKFAGEPTIFEAQPGSYFQPGFIVGYIQPAAGTVTFSRIFE